MEVIDHITNFLISLHNSEEKNPDRSIIQTVFLSNFGEVNSLIFDCITTCITGKSITMLCNFQDLQAESSAVLLEVDVRKRFHFAYTGTIEAVSAVR